MQKRLFILGVLLLFTALTRATQCATANYTFQNPVYSFIADPFIMKWNGLYFMYGTATNFPVLQVCRYVCSHNSQKIWLVGVMLEMH
jgi:hypothetical protein